MKLISLVNLCSCAGLGGLIRPGTWRPPGQYSSICMKDLVKAEIRLKETFFFPLPSLRAVGRATLFFIYLLDCLSKSVLKYKQRYVLNLNSVDTWTFIKNSVNGSV